MMPARGITTILRPPKTIHTYIVVMPLAGIPRGILSGGQVEKGPLSTRSGGQPQGPQPRTTPPLPLRASPHHGTKPTPERPPQGVTTCDLTRPVQDVVTPLVGVRPAHLHSLQKNEPHPLDSAHRVLLRNRQVTLRE